MNIFITGASEGIGRELAKLYGTHGNRVYAISRNEKRLEELSEEIKSNGGESYYESVDVTNSEAAKKSVNSAIDKMGGIDLAILNAGVSAPTSFTESHLDIVKLNHNVNFYGVVNFTEIILPYMKSIGSGTVAAVSSLADCRGFEGAGPYSASKIALTTLMESARTEMKKYGVNVLTIRPGFIDTNLTKKNKYPMPFIMDVQKGSRKIKNAIDRNKSIYSFPWQTKMLTDLLRFIPNSVYEFLATRIDYKGK